MPTKHPNDPPRRMVRGTRKTKTGSRGEASLDEEANWLRRLEVIEKAILPHCREFGLPFALMLGVRRAVNPQLRLAGDGTETLDPAAARDGQPENIEELIDQLLQLERRMEGQWREGIRNGERLLRLLKKAPPSHRSSMEPLVRKILDTLQEVKETTRDARWQLIVVRAEMLPKGEGPVFDNGRELGQALDKLKA